MINGMEYRERSLKFFKQQYNIDLIPFVIDLDDSKNYHDRIIVRINNIISGDVIIFNEKFGNARIGLLSVCNPHIFITFSYFRTFYTPITNSKDNTFSYDEICSLIKKEDHSLSQEELKEIMKSVLIFPRKDRGYFFNTI